MSKKNEPKNQFWKTVPLEKMSEEQWESLCDGCGKCCLIKLEDIDTGIIHYTSVGCKLLDCKTAKCTKYSERINHVPDCVFLTPKNLKMLQWMPKSCAYRLINEKKELPKWHPLLTGEKNSTLLAGQSVAERIVGENEVNENDLLDYIIYL